MSCRVVRNCDRCGLLHDSPEKPRGWMWTQRYDGAAESKDLCAKCVAEVFATGGKE